MPITSCFNSFSEAKIRTRLSRLLLIFSPSVPGTIITCSSIRASGTTKVSPIWWLKRSATSRVNSMCCFWSLPTGTKCASYNKMSAAISMG
jgi:hypothetical protein